MNRALIFLVSFSTLGLIAGCGAKKSNQSRGLPPGDPVTQQSQAPMIYAGLFRLTLQNSAVENAKVFSPTNEIPEPFDCKTPCKATFRAQSSKPIELDSLKLTFTSDLYPSGRLIPNEYFENIQKITDHDIKFDVAGFEEWTSAKKGNGNVQFEYRTSNINFEKGHTVLRLPIKSEQIVVTASLIGGGHNRRTEVLKNPFRTLYPVGSVTLLNSAESPVNLSFAALHPGQWQAITQSYITEQRKHDSTTTIRPIVQPSQAVNYFLIDENTSNWEATISLNRIAVTLQAGMTKKFRLYSNLPLPTFFKYSTNVVVDSEVTNSKSPIGGLELGPVDLNYADWELKNIKTREDVLNYSCFKCSVHKRDCLKCLYFLEEHNFDLENRHYWTVSPIWAKVPQGPQEVEENVSFSQPLQLNASWHNDGEVTPTRLRKLFTGSIKTETGWK